MLFSISGIIGSGKDTAADYFVDHHNFTRASFADTLKDAVAAVFGWDREMLAGRTKEAREEREQVDTWWAEKLEMPQLTPRWVLQYWGTEVCRQGFHQDIWIASLENMLRKNGGDVVITDARFPNELDMIHRLNGKCIYVSRGDNPEWFDFAKRYNAATSEGKMTMKIIASAHDALPNIFNRHIHASEWSWIGFPFDYELDNNGSLSGLYQQCSLIVPTPDGDQPRESMVVGCE